MLCTLVNPVALCTPYLLPVCTSSQCMAILDSVMNDWTKGNQRIVNADFLKCLIYSVI